MTDSSYTMETRVRYGECDPMGVVHHCVYPVWFELARTEMLRASGLSYADMEKSGTYIVVLNLDVKYHLPARYDDLLQITAHLRKVTHVKLVHEYEIKRDGELLVTGSTTLACIDAATGRATKVPDILRPE